MSQPQKIVDRANELARIFYEAHGYEVPKGYRFDKAHHPQEAGMWNLAVMAFAFIDGTNVDDALSEVE